MLVPVVQGRRHSSAVRVNRRCHRQADQVPLDPLPLPVCHLGRRVLAVAALHRAVHPPSPRGLSDEQRHRFVAYTQHLLDAVLSGEVALQERVLFVEPVVQVDAHPCFNYGRHDDHIKLL